MLSIDYIDASVLFKLNKIGGTELMSKTITHFYEHTRAKLELAWNAAKERDITGLIREIQTVKVRIDGVGAIGFVEHVSRLEKAAVSQERRNYYALLEELAAGLIVIHSRLENIAAYLTSVGD